MWFQHPAGRVLSSNWSGNSFITFVNENFFQLEVSVQMHNLFLMDFFSHRQPL